MPCNKTLTPSLISTVNLYKHKMQVYKLCIACAQKLLYIFTFLQCVGIDNTQNVTVYFLFIFFPSGRTSVMSFEGPGRKILIRYYCRDILL